MVVRVETRSFRVTNQWKNELQQKFSCFQVEHKITELANKTVPPYFIVNRSTTPILKNHKIWCIAFLYSECSHLRGFF